MSGGSAGAIGLRFGELRRRLDARELRVADLVEQHLARIEALADLHAYRHVDADGARAAAAAADRELDAGARRGPLHGIPIGVKESWEVAGLPATNGSRAFADHVAEHDATVVARLRAGGAIVLGMQAMSENAIGDLVRDGPRATGRNPRHPDYVSAGSSSGSAAATAAGLAVVSLGADGGGSVRNPAAAVGVVGLKPTETRLPVDGGYAWTFSMSTAGLFGREVAAVEAAFGPLAETASAALPETPPRLAALHPDDLGELDPGVAGAYRAALAAWVDAGATVVEAPPVDLASAGPAWFARMRELAHAHELTLLGRRTRYTEGMRAFLAASAAVPIEEYVASFATADRLRDAVDGVLAGVDALVTPANPWPGLRWEEWPSDRVFPWYRFCFPFNLTGHPGVTLPWSLDAIGLPLAVTLVGRRGGDEALLALAGWCEARGSFDPSPIG